MAREKTAKYESPRGGADHKRLAAGSALGPQLKQFWDAQEKILSEAEAFSRHWFARRREATQAALEACQKASEANPADATAALQALRDWQAHSAERLAEDMREWFDMWSRCAGHFVSGEVEAGTETLEELQREMDAGLHARHATPV